MDIERDEDFLTQFVAKQLKLQRERKDITQDQLARLLGVNILVIQNAEMGVERIEARSLHEACQVFGVSLRSFFRNYAEELAAERSVGSPAILPEEQRVA